MNDHSLPPTLRRFDQVEVLPPIAAGKLRRLRDKPATSYAVLRVTMDRMAEARQQLQEAQVRVGFLRAPPSGRGIPEDADHPSMNEARKQRDDAQAELARLQPIHDAQASVWNIHGNLAREVEGWVSRRAGKLVDHDFATPTLRKGEDLLAAIEARRRRGRELAADLHQVQSAPILSSVAKQRMRHQVCTIAERGEPAVGGLIEFGSEITFPTAMHRTVAQGEQLAYVGMELPDAMAFQFWLNKDAIIKKLEAAIDAESDDKAALSGEDRAKRIATITADMLANERDECALVWLAQEQGLPVEHRVDIDPLALLGVSEVGREPVVQTYSSPQHAALEMIVPGGGRASSRSTSRGPEMIREGGYNIPAPLR